MEACRKRKRDYGFQSFCESGDPIRPMGPFRDNIRLFLQKCADPQDYTVNGGMPIWCTPLVVRKNHDSSLVVPLFTIEEKLHHYSRDPFCKHCRSTGWSNHFVSKIKYHMIIPMDEDWDKPLDDSIFNVSTHLLHALIHCNGFAHLLCINGLEGGSEYLSGREVMDLWDRICTNLRIRKITVVDVSKKRSMDLRLLHGVAYGHSWFGRWGYKFCHGSFGVRKHMYEEAIETLCSLHLDIIIHDFSDMEQCEELRKIIAKHRLLSEARLVTVKDLLRFMLTVRTRPSLVRSAKTVTSESPQIEPLMKENSTRYKKFATVADMDSRYSKRRLVYAAEVIVNALKENKEKDFKNGGMARQDVRNAARLHIGDTGLLDYVLKSLDNVIVGNHIVCRTMNPATHILEFTVHDICDRIKVAEPEIEILLQSQSQRQPQAHLFPLAASAPALVYDDVLYLYEHVLLGYPEFELVELASRAVLDAKHFVKECLFEDEQEQLVTLYCQISPSLVDREEEFERGFPPGEMVVMPWNATLGDLKREAEMALRETYFVTERFVLTEIIGLEEANDMEVISRAVHSGTEVGVRGSEIDLQTPLRYEGGSGSWMVRCDCGAMDDDGERMVACTICEVWQHTRCHGLDEVPPLHICSCCSASLVPAPLKSDLSAAVLGADMDYGPGLWSELF